MNKIAVAYDLKLNHNAAVIEVKFQSGFVGVKLFLHGYDSKSSGCDEISSNLIKSCKILLTDPFVFISNLIMSADVFPPKLKLKIVLALYEIGDPYDLHNYRAISLIPSFSKVFEICLKDKPYSFYTVIKYYHISTDLLQV